MIRLKDRKTERQKDKTKEGKKDRKNVTKIINNLNIVNQYCL